MLFQVEAHGPGLQPSGVVQGQPTEFTVDCRKAGGHAPLDISVMDKDLKPVDLKVTDNLDATFKAQYKPTQNDKHTVQVNYGGVAIPKSPFRVSSYISRLMVWQPIASFVYHSNPLQHNIVGNLIL